MKIYCRGEYHNPPAGLHFANPGVVEIDDAKAEFLLRDAPENFTRELPAPAAPPEASDQLVEPTADATKAVDAPPHDKQIKSPSRKK